MGSDRLVESINVLIDQVNGVDSIAVGKINTDVMFPYHIIASLHNHLGNIKQFVSEGASAFNASDQFLALNSALKELGEVRENLLQLHQTNVISDALYQYLDTSTRGVVEQLSQATNPEYL